MVTVNFGKKNEPSFELRESPDLIAVRTRAGLPTLRSPAPVLTPAAAELDDAELVSSFPDAGVEVFRIQTRGTRTRSLTERKAALRSSPEIRFAGSVLVDPQTGEPVLYTENLFIKFLDALAPEVCRQVIQAAGLSIKKEVAYANNAYLVAAPEGTGQTVFAIAEELLKRDDVEYCHPELIRQRAKKAIASQQWHLRRSELNGHVVDAHANVELAHTISRGQGIIIAVIDDGVDIDHPEFSGTGKVVHSRDVALASDDPRPRLPTDNHGTACAGVACANGTHGASGVAPEARLMPIRLDAGLGSELEAEAFRWATDHGADVISCSWGPQDGSWRDPNDVSHDAAYALPAHTRLAIEHAVTKGRSGRGCVVFFAAGNGNEAVDTDQYASNPLVMAVAACNDRGQRSIYSDYGQAVCCAFPSNDFGAPELGQAAPLTTGIWTTDRQGAPGYNPGKATLGDVAGHYTNRFGGTSSACPGAAGVAALVLSQQPGLRWQEVRDVLRRCCDRIDPQGGNYHATTGHSPKYGYGRLNALRALELARPVAQDTVSVIRQFGMNLPDLRTTSFRVAVAEEMPVAALRVYVHLRHNYVGDLVLRLFPPAQTGLPGITLQQRVGGAGKELKRYWDSSSIPALGTLAGRSCQGEWRLEVQDAAARDSGSLHSFGVELHFGTGALGAGRGSAAVPAKLARGSGQRARSASARKAQQG